VFRGTSESGTAGAGGLALHAAAWHGGWGTTLASEEVRRVEVHAGVEIESLVRDGVRDARWRRVKGRFVLP
jgi:hypothetical protein